MCFVKSKYKKKQLFIHHKYFTVLYRSFVNMLKLSHVTSNKNSHSNHYKIINSYKVKQGRRIKHTFSNMFLTTCLYHYITTRFTVRYLL